MAGMKNVELIEKDFVIAKKGHNYYGLYDFAGCFLGTAFPNREGFFKFINNGSLHHLDMAILRDVADILEYLNGDDKGNPNV